MLDFGYYNMDCMDGMKQFPDRYFDLAIVDVPYGIARTVVLEFQKIMFVVRIVVRKSNSGKFQKRN